MINRDRLLAAIQLQGLTPKKLAAQIGVTPAMISAIARQERTPSLRVLVRMANRLDVPLDFLVERNNLTLPIDKG